MAKQQKQKYVPMRMCLVTRVRKPKNELIRIVRTADDEVVIDPKGKTKGRGANIERSIDVLEVAINKGLLKKALRLERDLTPEEITELKDTFIRTLEEKDFRKGNKPVKIRVRKGKVEKVEG